MHLLQSTNFKTSESVNEEAKLNDALMSNEVKIFKNYVLQHIRPCCEDKNEYSNNGQQKLKKVKRKDNDDIIETNNGRSLFSMTINNAITLEELVNVCTKHYSDDEMKLHLENAYAQYLSGDYIEFDAKVIQDLAEKHGIQNCNFK